MATNDELSERLSEIYRRIDKLKARASTDPDQVEKVLSSAIEVTGSSHKWHTSTTEQSDQHYPLLFETMRQGVVYQDADGTILSMNPSAEMILGKTQEEFLGSSSVGQEHFTIREDGSPFPGLEHPAMVALRTGQEVHDVVMGVFNPREDCCRWININAVPLYQPGEDKPYQVYTIFDDITERKRALEAMRESEDRYRKLFETMNEGFILAEVVTDGEGRPIDYRFLDVNPASERFFGRSREEIVGYTYKTIGGANADPEWIEVLCRVALTREAVSIDRYAPVGGHWVHLLAYSPRARQFAAIFDDITERKRAEIALQEANEEQEVITEELRQQNDELVSVQSELRESEERYRDLVENANSIIIKMDRAGKINFFNDYAQKFFGYSLEEILGQNVMILVPPIASNGSNLEEMADSILENPDSFAENINENVRKNGERVWISWRNKAIRDARGEIIGNLTIGQDITERKRSAEELAKAHALLDALLEMAHIGFAFLDRELRYVLINKKLAEMNGFAVDAHIGKRVHDIVPTLVPAIQIVVDQIVETGQSLKDHEFSTENASAPGVKRYWDESWYPMKDSSGEITGFGVVVEEITERKRATEAVSRNEKMLRAVLEQMPSGVTIRDAKTGALILSNNQAREIMGSLVEFPEQFTPQYRGLHLDGRPYTTEEWPISRSMAKGEVVNAEEIECERNDGTRITLSFSSAPVRDSQGQTVIGVGIFHNITERKRAEEELRKNEAQFKVLIQNLNSGVALVDEDGKFTIVNPTFLKMFGLSEDQSDIKNVNDQNWVDWQVFEEDGSLLHVDDHPVRKAAMTGKPVRNKLVGVRLPSGGDLTWMLISAEPILKPDGKIDLLICTYHDITARKRAEDILQTELQRFYAILSSMYSGILLVKDDGGIEFANKAFCDLFDLLDSPEDLMGLTSPQLLEKIENAYHHPDEEIARIKEIVDRGQPVMGEEIVMSRGRTCLRDFIPIHVDGKSYGRLWHHLEITERKRAEEALRESEEKYRNLFNSMAEGFALHEIICDEEGKPYDYRFLDANQAFERLTGLKRDEVIGKTERQLFPGDDPQRIEIYGSVALTGHPAHFETHSNILNKYYDVYAHSPAPGRFAAFFVDITARKQIETALRESEENYRTIVETANEGIWVVDSETRTTYVNRKMAEMLGYGPEEMIGMKSSEFMDENGKARLGLLLERRRQGINESYEIKFLRKNGASLWAISSAAPLRDKEGKFAGSLGMLTNITERKRTEEALLDPVMSWNIGSGEDRRAI